MRRIAALLAIVCALVAAPVAAQTNSAYPTIPASKIQPSDFIMLEGTRFTVPVYTTLPIMAQYMATAIPIPTFSGLNGYVFCSSAAPCAVSKNIVPAELYGVSTANTDNTAALQNAVSSVAATGGGTILLPYGILSFASSSLSASNGIVAGAHVDVLGAGKLGTMLQVTGVAAATFFTDTNTSGFRIRNVYAIGNGVDGGFGNGGFFNVYLHKETATSDLTDVWVEDSILQNFTTARWISFLHHGLNSITYDATYKMARVGTRNNYYKSVSGNNPGPQLLGQTRSFVEFNGYLGPIRNAVVDDRVMDGYYVKSGLGVFSDVADSVFSVDAINDVGVSGATNDVGAYAVINYQSTYGTPKRNRYRVGTIANPWSIGVYTANSNDNTYEVGECYGQVDTASGTLGKGCMNESGGYNNSYRFGRIYNSAFGVYVSGFDSTNADVASNRHISIDARVDYTQTAVKIVGGGGSSWGGGVKLTGEINALGLAAADGIVFGQAGAGISDFDIDMRVIVTGRALNMGPAGGEVLKDGFIRKNKYQGGTYSLYSGGGQNWNNVDIRGDFYGVTSGNTIQLVNAKKFKLDARVINQTSGYAAYLDGSQGTLRMEYLNTPNPLYPSATPLGGSAPTWAGNIGDFVQNLNPALGGSPGFKYVLTGWSNLSGTTTWAPIYAYTDVAALPANSLAGNATASATSPAGVAVPSCSAASNALLWTTNSGFSCNAAIAAATATAATTAATVSPVVSLGSATAPTISSGFCATAPAVVNPNGTWAFTINVGTACASSAGTLSMPAATNGWTCKADNTTTPASNVVYQTGGTASTVVLTNYVRTTGIAGNFTANDILRVMCHSY